MRLLLVSQHPILDFICSLQDRKVPKTTLDEHFRSFPQLASFTSDTFYQVDGGLRLMREVPKNLELQCFDCVEVGGTRDAETKIVSNEVDELLRWLTKLVRARHYEHDPGLRAHGFTNERPPTLGVISFLRSQRDAIRERVVEEFSPAEMQLCNLLVGTPEDFQGNERDIIFITLGLDGVGRWGRGHYEDRKRFNVATSRAIHYTLLIYGGIPSNARLIKSYLTHFGKSWRTRQENEPNEAQPTVHRYRWDWNRTLHRELCESEFEHRVADCLEEFVEQHGGQKRIKLFNQVQAWRVKLRAKTAGFCCAQLCQRLVRRCGSGRTRPFHREWTHLFRSALGTGRGFTAGRLGNCACALLPLVAKRLVERPERSAVSENG
jgi:hypothetical protein